MFVINKLHTKNLRGNIQMAKFTGEDLTILLQFFLRIQRSITHYFYQEIFSISYFMSLFLFYLSDVLSYAGMSFLQDYWDRLNRCEYTRVSSAISLTHDLRLGHEFKPLLQWEMDIQGYSSIAPYSIVEQPTPAPKRKKKYMSRIC